MFINRAIFLLAIAWNCLVAQGADLRIVQETAEQHIRLQTQGLPGTPTITIGSINISRLPPCSVHEAFTPQGSSLVGKTLIGVRCLAPNSWSVLIPAQIAVSGNYVTSSRPLVAGQVIQSEDLATISGDVSRLPAGIVADPTQAIGKTLRNSLGAGQPIRKDQLLAALVIRQGQTVHVTSRGPGFSASAEGKALNNAAEGQIVQIRMISGQTVNGVAQNDGSVEISF